MKIDNNFKYTCLFGGGAIRGAAHVGVLKALKELRIEPTTLAGSSVGSIVASLLAVGYNTDELAEIFLAVNFELFRDISFGFNQKFALSKGEVFLDWIRELIEKKFYGENYNKGESKHVTFKDLKRNLVIITTKMKEFSCQEFSNFETPDFEVAMAVRISCCMPGLMRAVHYENEILVDGDLLKGKPMWFLSKTLKNSSDRILEIRLEGNFSGSDDSPIEYVNGMYTCMTNAETSFIKSIYGYRDKYDYLVIDTGNVIVVDFNYPPDKRQAIIDEGYKQTISYFKDYLVSKKEKISSIYTEILDYLRQMQGFLIRKKYNMVKSVICELFVYLFDTKDIIDENLNSKLSHYQKLVYKNIKSGLLGYVNCQDKNKIQDSLDELIKNLTERINELEMYIKKYS